jgi:hypothetical protein
MHRTVKNAFVAQATLQLTPETVAADATNHRHVGAQARSRDGLIGTLATWCAHEAVAGDRLAGLRQALHLDNQIHVQATKYHHPQPRHGGMLASWHFMTEADGELHH